jgi:hypothetical protein
MFFTILINSNVNLDFNQTILEFLKEYSLLRVDTWQCDWLRHYATRRKVADSIPVNLSLCLTN